MDRNSSRIIYVIVILAVLFGLLYWWQSRRVDEGLVTNGQMLQNENDTAIVTEPEVEYFGTAKGYLARPQAPGNYPGIVVIHENRGLRPEILRMTEQLAREGYMALAVDLFEGKVVETQDEARQLTAAFDQEKGLDNLKAAVGYLRSQGATKVASLGWCFGGGQSLRLGLSGQPMDATVIYYGQLATTTTALAPIKWPVLGIFGATDQAISVESVNQFDKALDDLGVNNEIYIYPGVGHAFANPSGMNYAPEETRDAWEKTLEFLQRNL